MADSLLKAAFDLTVLPKHLGTPPLNVKDIRSYGPERAILAVRDLGKIRIGSKTVEHHVWYDEENDILSIVRTKKEQKSGNDGDDR
jgi:hypothetical protein